MDLLTKLLGASSSVLLLAELLDLDWVRVDNCYDMVLERVTVDKYVLHERSSLVSSLKLLRDDVFSLR